MTSLGKIAAAVAVVIVIGWILKHPQSLAMHAYQGLLGGALGLITAGFGMIFAFVFHAKGH